MTQPIPDTDGSRQRAADNSPDELPAKLLATWSKTINDLTEVRAILDQAIAQGSSINTQKLLCFELCDRAQQVLEHGLADNLVATIPHMTLPDFLVWVQGVVSVLNARVRSAVLTNLKSEPPSADRVVELLVNLIKSSAPPPPRSSAPPPGDMLDSLLSAFGRKKPSHVELPDPMDHQRDLGILFPAVVPPGVDAAAVYPPGRAYLPLTPLAPAPSITCGALEVRDPDEKAATLKFVEEWRDQAARSPDGVFTGLTHELIANLRMGVPPGEVLAALAGLTVQTILLYSCEPRGKPEAPRLELRRENAQHLFSHVKTFMRNYLDGVPLRAIPVEDHA